VRRMMCRRRLFEGCEVGCDESLAAFLPPFLKRGIEGDLLLLLLLRSKSKSPQSPFFEGGGGSKELAAFLFYAEKKD